MDQAAKIEVVQVDQNWQPKDWDTHLSKATWLINIRGSTNWAGPAQSKPQHSSEGDKVPVVHMWNVLGKTVWVNPTSGKGKPVHGTAFSQ